MHTTVMLTSTARQSKSTIERPLVTIRRTIFSNTPKSSDLYHRLPSVLSRKPVMRIRRSTFSAHSTGYQPLKILS
jgi:hypothetical protein